MTHPRPDKFVICPTPCIARCICASHHVRGMEKEVRDIPEEAVEPAGRVRWPAWGAGWA